MVKRGPTGEWVRTTNRWQRQHVGKVFGCSGSARSGENADRPLSNFEIKMVEKYYEKFKAPIPRNVVNIGQLIEMGNRRWAWQEERRLIQNPRGVTSMPFHSPRFQNIETSLIFDTIRGNLPNCRINEFDKALALSPAKQGEAPVYISAICAHVNQADIH